MYIALKPLKLRQPDCTVATIEVGKEVPGFSDWPSWTQQAMLQQQQVRWAPEGLAPHEHPSAQRKVVQHLPSGAFTPPAKPVEPEPVLHVPNPSTEPNRLAVGADEQNPAVPDETAYELPPAEKLKPEETIYKAANAAPVGGPAITVTREVPQKGAHDCPKCDRQGFKDYNGLRIHMARAHKNQE